MKIDMEGLKAAWDGLNQLVGELVAENEILKERIQELEDENMVLIAVYEILMEKGVIPEVTPMGVADKCLE